VRCARALYGAHKKPSPRSRWGEGRNTGAKQHKNAGAGRAMYACMNTCFVHRHTLMSILTTKIILSNKNSLFYNIKPIFCKNKAKNIQAYFDIQLP
jgi:hypothetical protein